MGRYCIKLMLWLHRASSLCLWILNSLADVMVSTSIASYCIGVKSSKVLDDRLFAAFCYIWFDWFIYGMSLNCYYIFHRPIACPSLLTWLSWVLSPSVTLLEQPSVIAHSCLICFVLLCWCIAGKSVVVRLVCDGWMIWQNYTTKWLQQSAPYFKLYGIASLNLWNLRLGGKKRIWEVWH